jgi:hypothetical protein
VLGKYVPPAPGVQPPSLWGVESHLETLFGDAAAEIAITHRTFTFRYASAGHFVDVFRSWYGPVHKAFAALDEQQAVALEADLVALIDRFNRSGSNLMVVPSEYLEVVITRR